LHRRFAFFSYVKDAALARICPSTSHFSSVPGNFPSSQPIEVQRVIDSAENLMRRAMVMTLYSTGIRCSELCHLKASDVDSERSANLPPPLKRAVSSN